RTDVAQRLDAAPASFNTFRGGRAGLFRFAAPRARWAIHRGAFRLFEAAVSEWVIFAGLRSTSSRPTGGTRPHSAKQIPQIADSIAAFGFVVPILIDDDGVIIAGHGRYAAAKLLDLKQVPAIKVQSSAKVANKTQNYADNKRSRSRKRG